MILYKYYDLSKDYNKNAIENGYFYFSKPSEVNDIYDCKPIFVYDYEKIDNLSDYRENIDYKIREDKIYLLNPKAFSDSLRILSLSEKKDSILMWSHYSSYSGICIGYELDKSSSYFCIETINTNINKKGSFIGEDNQIPLNKITYRNNDYLIPDSINNKSRQKINNSLLRKKRIWKYEKEWRAIVTRDELKLSSIDDDKVKIYYDKARIKEVILGLNITDDNIKFIKNIYGNETKYFYATRSKEKSKMKIVSEI